MNSLELNTHGSLSSILLSYNERVLLEVESATNYIKDVLAFYMISILQYCRSNECKYRKFKVLPNLISIVNTDLHVLPSGSMLSMIKLLKSRTFKIEGSTRDYKVIYSDEFGDLFYRPYNSRDGTIRVYRNYNNQLVYRIK